MSAMSLIISHGNMIILVLNIAQGNSVMGYFVVDGYIKNKYY